MVQFVFLIFLVRISKYEPKSADPPFKRSKGI